MKPFTQHRGLVAGLARANVDTDQIIPKQFLKSIKRTGFETSLFFDWRYLPGGAENPEFELNAARFKGASVLVTGNNFGCGSSREHAVWAIHQYGFRVIIAPWQEAGGTRVPGFADIFRNNCTKNGVLTVELSGDQTDRIFEAIKSHPGLEVTADLEKQQIILHLPKEMRFDFKLDPATKEHLLQGLDEIEKTLRFEDSIEKFEASHNVQWHASGSPAV